MFIIWTLSSIGLYSCTDLLIWIIVHRKKCEIKKSKEVIFIMRLFKKSKEEKERKELKGKIDKLMKSYSNEKIDGDTYFKKMMKLTSTYKKKK